MSNENLVELPFRAEYSKSNRASCKSCKSKIEKDHLRLAAMVQSPMFDGKVPHWYHFNCFFIKQRPKAVGDISHFESLRWDDQERIRGKLEALSSSSTSGSSKPSKRKGSTQKSTGDFKIEYSKSSRALCRGCESKIIKGDIRASKKDFDSQDGRRYGGIDLWHHLNCFAELRHSLEFWDSGIKLPGFKLLKEEDRAKVKELLPEVAMVKKEENETNGVDPPKKPKMTNDELKKQNELMFYFRDSLKLLPKKSLIELLQYNNQDVPEGQETLLDRLADLMAFGALSRCSTCKSGQLVFRSGIGYFCLGHSDEWTKCESTFDEPTRSKFKIPKELKEEYAFLAKYKYKPMKRLFEKNPSADVVDANSHQKMLKSIKSDPLNAGPRVARNLPLKRMEFCISGHLSRTKDEIKLEIMKLGGTLGSRVHPLTTAVLATEDAIKKKLTAVVSAQQLNIHVVPESFIDEMKNGCEAISCINRLNLVSWGSDPSSRLSADVPDTKSMKSKSNQFKSSGPTKIKLVVKDGIAVDPDSNLQDLAHVYRDHKDNVYNASLSLTDLQTGKNSFYKLQILESENKNTYWLFRAWGRIGTTIGGNKVEKLDRNDAIKTFKQLFEERTANSWDDRKNFRKVPGKMVMMDICYDDNEKSIDVTDTCPSKLEKPVQSLVQFIFNINIMKSVMKEMEIDLEKMPLGKLSKKQIQEAYQVLTKLQDCLSDDKAVDTKTIISNTNKFYTLVPHDFGTDNPVLLNDIELIKQKTLLLDSLMDIEIAYSMLKSGNGEGSSCAVDTHYMRLNANLSTLDRTCTEFEIIQRYVENTHAETHRNYQLEILEVFKVDRHGEDRRYEPFRKLHNRKLLWHGSRSTNFAGILSQGLRIAPPEAPVTGYMFGKGVYFADMVSKSANYCMTSPTNNIGLLLLCEVALGNMMELLRAQNVTKLPKDKHSVKGVGKTHPDPGMSITVEDGIEVPLGKGVPVDKKNSSLLYNEYIVYDVAQVRVKYLVQTKFNFNY